MAKDIEFKYGAYTRGNKCSSCTWRQQPELRFRSICPACGEELERVTGRWLYQRTKGWFFWGEWKLVTFVPSGEDK